MCVCVFFFFQIAISLLACVATFSGQLYFWRGYVFHNFSEWLLRHSSYIFRADIFSEQLLFSSFAEQPFFAAVFFSEWLLLQNETFTEQALPENEKFFMAVTFRNSCLSMFKIKVSKKELLFQGRYQLFQKSYISEKDNFSEKQYSAKPTFSGELLF